MSRLPKRGEAQTFDDDQDDIAADFLDAPQESEAERIANSVLTSLGGETENAVSEVGGAQFVDDEDIITTDEFFETFVDVFDQIAFMSGIEEIGIMEGEEKSARKASDGMYRLLKRWYRSALVPETGDLKGVFDTIMCLAVVGSFIYGKLAILREGLANKKALILAQSSHQTPVKEPAPDQPAPEFHSTRVGAPLDDWGGGAVPS
ncbi:hypothetical protein [Planktotalea arctica]|uniref:hypothetical protein n=1 Tax=Planktotalea arctica TaxID=1481893 RepID=UPI00321B6ED7